MPKKNLKCQLRKNSVRKASKWLGNKTKPNQECTRERQTQQNDVANNALVKKNLRTLRELRSGTKYLSVFFNESASQNVTLPFFFYYT